MRGRGGTLRGLHGSAWSTSCLASLSSRSVDRGTVVLMDSRPGIQPWERRRTRAEMAGRRYAPGHPDRALKMSGMHHSSGRGSLWH